MNEIFTTLSDATVRMERVIYLPGALADFSSSPDSITELSEDLDSPELLAECFPDMEPERIDDVFEEGFDLADFLFDWMRDAEAFGFVVKFARPVREYYATNQWRSSWGRYGTCWRYGDTLEETVKRALEWGEARNKAEIEAMRNPEAV